MSTTSPVIVALDYDDQNKALGLVDHLDPSLCALKVGSELFSRFGATFVARMVQMGFRVFLDLKFHDIPNTVANSCRVAADLGVWMVNVHASGGSKMMQAAQKAVHSYGQDRPLLIAVTVLTSFDEEDLQEIGIERPIQSQVLHLANMAYQCDLDGVVCSAHEARSIKTQCPNNFMTVTPGIRLAHDSSDDQVRIMTPEKAMQSGSDYLVIGRSITRAENPANVLNDIMRTL